MKTESEVLYCREEEEKGGAPSLKQVPVTQIGD